MKVVYNACHGGFGLSEKAIARFAEIKGITLYPETWAPFGMSMVRYWTVPESERKDGSLSQRLEPHEISRSDPALVQVVEELGEAANGAHANLLIRDVPAGSKYKIDEYDGFESVHTVDEYEWIVAE